MSLRRYSDVGWDNRLVAMSDIGATPLSSGACDRKLRRERFSDWPVFLEIIYVY